MLGDTRSSGIKVIDLSSNISVPRRFDSQTREYPGRRLDADAPGCRDGLTFIHEAALLQAAAASPSAVPGNLGQFSQWSLSLGVWVGGGLGGYISLRFIFKRWYL